MTGVRVRWAEVDDALGIAEVHVASWQSAYRGLIEQDVLDNLSVSNRARSWSRVLSEIAASNQSSTCELEPHRILVADVDERIVGWASFGAGRDEGVSDQGEIAGLYVHPDFWHRKVGHSLLGSAELQLSDAGFSSAYLWVLFGNSRAITFYESHGWAADGEEKRGRAGGATDLRELRHVRELKPMEPSGGLDPSSRDLSPKTGRPNRQIPAETLEI